MFDKNKFGITGNLVADPELRYTPKGTAVVRARIIHTDSYRDRETGEWIKGKPMGIDFVIWRAYAEAFVKKAKKGTYVFLEGPMERNDFEGKDGSKHYGQRLKVEEFQILAQPRAKDEEGQNPEPQIDGPEEEEAAEPEQVTQPKARTRRGSNAAANG